MKNDFDGSGYRHNWVRIGGMSLDYYQYTNMAEADGTLTVRTYHGEVDVDIDAEKAKVIIEFLQEAFNLE